MKDRPRDRIQEKVQVWIVNRTPPGDEVLLLQVVPDRGSGWHPVTGSVDKPEVKARDWLGAAKRETEEETGIPSEAGVWIDVNHVSEFEGRWGPARERTFALILRDFRGSVTLDPSEHVARRWVPLGVAPAELGFSSQRLGLEAVVGCLQALTD
jgi:8-oxo-dGTP pyrophosphatase MutT (NUDIX family)